MKYIHIVYTHISQGHGQGYQKQFCPQTLIHTTTLTQTEYLDKK